MSTCTSSFDNRHRCQSIVLAPRSQSWRSVSAGSGVYCTAPFECTRSIGPNQLAASEIEVKNLKCSDDSSLARSAMARFSTTAQRTVGDRACLKCIPAPPPKSKTVEAPLMSSHSPGEGVYNFVFWTITSTNSGWSYPSMVSDGGISLRRSFSNIWRMRFVYHRGTFSSKLAGSLEN